ncbi:hypothetical protein RQP46_000934 [Phenoliferia psychrophenolica]
MQIMNDMFAGRGLVFTLAGTDVTNNSRYSNNQFKSIKGPAAKIDRDTTLGHEVGHWMGLDHTWGGGATKDADGNTINGCSKDNGDFVDDTAAQAVASDGGCDKDRVSCPGAGAPPDDTSNYMDYAADSCQTHFTQGQGDRMIAQAALYRGIP